MLPPFVKKFDFRGVYEKDITDKDGFYLGLAVQKSLPLKRILVGWDTRVSSKHLARNFIQAFQGTNIEINYIDICPIDFITAAANSFAFDFSVMFTGSHNPWNWTGLLMHTAGGASVEGELVNKIVAQYNQALSTPYQKPTGSLSDYINFQPIIESIYKKKISALIPLEDIKSMRVCVDLGDGSGYKGLEILEDLLPQVTFHRLNDRKVYNAQTPHTADPSQVENMQQLMQEVREGDYDCGIAFDSDADRALAVDEKGNYINGTLIGSAMMDICTSLRLPIHTFGYAVECGPSLYNTARTKENIQTMPVPVGRSIMRRLIRENKVDLAVENVGHFYNKAFFMTDSGAFSLVQILYWISTYGKLSTLVTEHPDGQRTQFTIPRADDQAAALEKLTATINQKFAGRVQKKIEVDGIRYEFYEGETLTTWYAWRPSGYEPIEKYYFGSLNQEDYLYLQEKIRKD
ncbi:MAG: hypothetical protein ACR2LN_02350 [Candidatus Levyibacteriota bacterium]